MIISDIFFRKYIFAMFNPPSCQHHIDRLRKSILRVILIAVFFLVSTGGCFPVMASVDSSSEERFETAAKLIDMGKYLEALGVYQEIADYAIDMKTKAKALLFMGNVHSLYLEQFDTALKKFEMIVKCCPDSLTAPDAVFNIGMVYYQQAKFEKALEWFNKYIQSYPQGMRRLSAELWAQSAASGMANQTPAHSFQYELPSSNTVVRVLVKKNAARLILGATGRLIISDSAGENLFYDGAGPVILSKTQTTLTINGKPCGAKVCRVDAEGTTVAIDQQSYRGFFMISSTAEGLDAVNHVMVEEYLYGVVPREMSPDWSEHALMAQAVAARTYALYIREKNRMKPYDLEAGTASQVYGGYSAETEWTNNAVDATKGQVMTYDGKLIIAYFHSDSGGHTEDAGNVWRVELPYLKGIPDRFGGNCVKTGWEYFLSYDAASALLKKSGFNVGKIHRLTADGKSRSGRTLSIRIFSDRGRFAMTSNNFRISIGADKIKSSCFDVIPQFHGILFKGKGYGHGVGMSQWGAYQMAQTGFVYPAILNHYYQGIKIQRLKPLSAGQKPVSREKNLAMKSHSIQ